MAYQEFAYFYDEFNGAADYDALFAYVTGELKAHGIQDGIVADFGCGTGELTLMLAQAGYDMIGIDVSEEMLSVLRDKADALGLPLTNPMLLCQDLLQLDLYGTIRAAVSTFDTYNHIGPLENFEKAIAKAAFFMEKDGIFVFDLNTPYKHEKVLSGQTFDFDEDDAACRWSNRYDPQTGRVDLSIDIHYKDTGEDFHESFSEYSYPLDTVKALLTRYCPAGQPALDHHGSQAVYTGSRRQPGLTAAPLLREVIDSMCETKNENSSNLLRGISENGGILFYGIDSTAIVRRMEQLHKTSAVTTAALGRLLTGVAMMGQMLKSDSDSVTVQIKGGGPAGRILAVSNGAGDVKGYVENSIVELPPRADGHLNVGAAVGKDGTLDVIRDLGMREPYIGQVPLVSGEIAEDITNYFAISEQTPTVCALGVLVNPDLTVQCAGGFIVQLMPGATEDEITRLEKNIGAMPGVTTLLQQGKSIPDILNMALDGFNPELLDSTRIDYCCDCSLDRVERTIRSLGKKEVEKLRDEDPIAEVNCQFCGKQYKVDLNDLLKNWPDTVEKQ